MAVKQANLAAAKSLRRRFGGGTYLENIRKYRREVALLKRKGLIDPEIDARKVLPSKALSSAITKSADVISGAVTPRKVSLKTAAKLKKAGVRVIRGKALVSPTYSVAGGELRQKKWSDGRGIKKIPNIQLGNRAFMRRQLVKIMGAMGPDEYLTVDLSPFMSKKLFRSDELDRFLDYLAGGDSFHNTEKKLTFGIVYVPSGAVNAYHHEVLDGTRKRDAEQRERDRARIAERKRQRAARKKGMRTGRGH